MVTRVSDDFKYKATIIFQSGEVIDEDDYAKINIEFDPPLDSIPDDEPLPPAYAIAREVFLHHVKSAIKDYLDTLEKDAEFEHVPVYEEEEDVELELEEDEDEEDAWLRHMEEAGIVPTKH